MDYSLGFELGQALLKLRRPWPALPGQEVEIDDGPDYLANLSSRIGYGLAVDWVRMGFLGAVETMTNVALNKPDMLSAVASRLDRLTDPAIRARIAYLWEAGEPLPTVFDDGFDSVTMATTTPRVR
ncbi:MAG: hypothetical protein JNJ44_11400 [Zoogloeaceae bacterium]|nr:hypothetical protein [Zoogloeaceae bacterium]